MLKKRFERHACNENDSECILPSDTLTCEQLLNFHRGIHSRKDCVSCRRFENKSKVANNALRAPNGQSLTDYEGKQ